MKIYGNKNETFAVAGGRVFLIQSQDMLAEFEEISELPGDAKPLSAAILSDFEVPEYVVTVDAASALGRKGGKSKSAAKSEAARANGRKGGRPKGVKNETA
jgi:hypothetical protein